jgi:hypothetical protein
MLAGSECIKRTGLSIKLLIGVFLGIVVFATWSLFLVKPREINVLLYAQERLQICRPYGRTVGHRGSFGILIVSETTIKVIASTLVRPLRWLIIGLSVPEHEN